MPRAAKAGCIGPRSAYERRGSTAILLPSEQSYGHRRPGHGIPNNVTTIERSTPPGKPTEASAGSATSSESGSSSSDVVLIHGVTADGQGLQVLRRRDGRIEAGAARPLKHGQPIQGEVVRLKPRKEFPLLCDVEVEVAAPKSAVAQSADEPSGTGRKGPARVTTERYRENWDAIWARPKKDGALLN